MEILPHVLKDVSFGEKRKNRVKEKGERKKKGGGARSNKVRK